MIGRKIAAVALSALTVLVLAATPSSAGSEGCQPPQETEACANLSESIRIAERRPGGARTQVVTIGIINSAHLDAQVVVEYQPNRAGSQPRVLLSAFVDTSASFAVTVPTFRLVDGRVTATVLCDTHHDASDVSVALSLAS